jgi:hypothetical protein
MTKRKFFWIIIGWWLLVTLPPAALSFWIAGYAQTIRVVPLLVAFLVFALALFWWSSRGRT